jgi:hypothetical protein
MGVNQVHDERSPDYDIAEPRADALIESLRAFGYTPEAAIADLVDNSISADAKKIRIDFHWAGRDSWVAVVDDGRGMSEQALLAAMRPGSTSPLEERADTDLGRFGLGLKTASFSQARELTVTSTDRAGGRVATRRWDLDTVSATGEWRLLRSAPNGSVDLESVAGGGTVVLWSKCDRLVGDVDSTDAKAQRRFLATADRVSRHLEATFHRFLSGRGRVSISLNGRELVPWDPFMLKNDFTQPLPAEDLPFRGEIVTVRPYVLPHRSKLGEDDSRSGAGATGWNQQQGFYIYRSSRLLVQGDWLGLGFAKDEHTKLARIAVEFPATLDHEWHVDVKKSSARPPGPLVDELRRVAASARRRAEEVYRFRGKIAAHRNSQDFVLAWQQYTDRSGDLRYRVNRKHPVVAALFDVSGVERSAIERALRFIEETVPTTLIGVSIADALDNQVTPYGSAKREIRPLIDFVFKDLVADGSTYEEAMNLVAAAEPFSQFPDVVAAYRESIS